MDMVVVIILNLMYLDIQLLQLIQEHQHQLQHLIKIYLL